MSTELPRLSSAAVQVVTCDSGKPPAFSPRCQNDSGARPIASRRAAIVRQIVRIRRPLQSMAVAPSTTPETHSGWLRAISEAIGPPIE